LPAGTHRHAHSHIGTLDGGPRQHQVGDIRARDQQHNRGENHQHLEALARLLLQVLNPSAARHDYHMLLGNDRRAAVRR